MTRVKICGIKEEAHALAAVKAGATFVGFVFGPSRRRVTPVQARNMISAVKKVDDIVQTVGVFVNMPWAEVNEIADFCGLDWVQLSGSESWEYCYEIARPIIKVIQAGGQPPEEIDAELVSGVRTLGDKKEFIALLDSHVEGQYGGTGMTFDWELAKPIAERFPVIIAGGLNPENVAQAIELVTPWGVDVSSGVEVEGVKDVMRIRAFIEAVRKADERQRRASA